MKPGSAVLPWTPWRVHCVLGSTGSCVLETGMAGPPAAGLNFQERANGVIASTPRRSGSVDCEALPTVCEAVCKKSLLLSSILMYTHFGHVVEYDNAVRSNRRPALHRRLIRAQIDAHHFARYSTDILWWQHGFGKDHIHPHPHRQHAGQLCGLPDVGIVCMASKSSLLRRTAGISTAGM